MLLNSEHGLRITWHLQKPFLILVAMVIIDISHNEV